MTDEPPRPAYNHTRGDAPSSPCPVCAQQYAEWLKWLAMSGVAWLVVRSEGPARGARMVCEAVPILLDEIARLRDRQQTNLETIRHLNEEIDMGERERFDLRTRIAGLIDRLGHG